MFIFFLRPTVEIINTYAAADIYRTIEMLNIFGIITLHNYYDVHRPQLYTQRIALIVPEEE